MSNFSVEMKNALEDMALSCELLLKEIASMLGGGNVEPRSKEKKVKPAVVKSGSAEKKKLKERKDMIKFVQKESKGGRSIAAICKDNNISIANYYRWKKELSQ